MPEPVDRLLRAMDSRRGITPFVGSGLSIESTGNAPYASWASLILDGIDVCTTNLTDLRPGWADTLKAHLQQGDVTSYLTAAQEVSVRLRNCAGGRVFANWLLDGVGDLRVRKRALPEAVGRLGAFILTTNYDTIIEQACPDRRTVSWDDDNAIAVVRDREEAVLHLHGVASRPDSIILGWSDYQRLADVPLQKFAKDALMTLDTLLFIGCGAGLDDPSVGPALRFAEDILPPGLGEHFLLVLGKDLRAALNRQQTLVTPVAYGAEHGELASFLEQLAAGLAPQVPQDPAAYETRSPKRPPVALLDLAGPADERLGDALEDTRRALRAIGQLERRTASPAGLLGWDLADQKAVLEQLAAAATSPIAWLGTNVAQLAVAVQDAGDLASQLLAPRFEDSRHRLEPLTHNIEELDSLVIDLERRLLAVLADLRDRVLSVHTYQASVEALKECAAHLEEARQSTSALLEGFQARRMS